MRSKILLIYTGGTIGMNRNPATGALEPFDFGHLLDHVPELRQIDARQQAPDHPILWNVPETDYLKFYLFQVV